LATRLPMKSIKGLGLQATTAETRSEFAMTCQEDLRAVLDAIGLDAHVQAHARDDVNAWRFLQVDVVRKHAPVKPTQGIDAARFSEASEKGASSLIIVHVSASTRILGILDRQRYWTKTRARMLAALLLAEGETHA